MITCIDTMIFIYLDQNTLKQYEGKYLVTTNYKFKPGRLMAWPSCPFDSMCGGTLQAQY